MEYLFFSSGIPEAPLPSPSSPQGPRCPPPPQAPAHHPPLIVSCYLWLLSSLLFTHFIVLVDFGSQSTWSLYLSLWERAWGGGVRAPTQPGRPEAQALVISEERCWGSSCQGVDWEGTQASQLLFPEKTPQPSVSPGEESGSRVRPVLGRNRGHLVKPTAPLSGVSLLPLLRV